MDIPKLIDNFYHQFNKSVEAKPHIEEGFYKVMSAYDWPGNVRELQNVMQMTVSLAGDSQLKVNLVPDYIRSELVKSSDEVLVRVESLEVVEKRVILNALEVCRGNVVHAAKALGIGRATLYRKMERYHLSVFRNVSK